MVVATMYCSCAMLNETLVRSDPAAPCEDWIALRFWRVVTHTKRDTTRHTHEPNANPVSIPKAEQYPHRSLTGTCAGCWSCQPRWARILASAWQRCSLILTAVQQRRCWSALAANSRSASPISAHPACLVIATLQGPQPMYTMTLSLSLES